MLPLKHLAKNQVPTSDENTPHAFALFPTVNCSATERKKPRWQALFFEGVPTGLIGPA
jgi:hypothetical protein